MYCSYKKAILLSLLSMFLITILSCKDRKSNSKVQNIRQTNIVEQIDSQVTVAQTTIPIDSPKADTIKPKPEKYERVTQADKLVFALDQMNAMWVIGEGGVRIPDGTFEKLSCNGQTVAVVNTKIVKGNINTTQYGKIRIRIGGTFGGLNVYLLPSQKVQMKSAYVK